MRKFALWMAIRLAIDADTAASDTTVAYQCPI